MVGDHPRTVDEQNPRETKQLELGWVQYPTLRGSLHYQLLNRSLSIKSTCIVIIHQIPLGDPLTSLVSTQIFSIKSSSLIQRSSFFQQRVETPYGFSWIDRNKFMIAGEEPRLMDTWKASAPLKSSNMCLQKYVAFPQNILPNRFKHYNIQIYNALISVGINYQPLFQNKHTNV